MDISNFLNLYDVYVNELIGGFMLAVIVTLIIVFFLAIKNKMPMELVVLFGLLILMIFSQGSTANFIWVFVVLAVGVMFYYNMQKAFK